MKQPQKDDLQMYLTICVLIFIYLVAVFVNGMKIFDLLIQIFETFRFYWN